MSGFQAPMTIRTAMEKIHNRDFLLPAIQRKFVWQHYQVELLFDSIMRGYPINSFMFWEIKNNEMKSEYRFYDFIQEFREFYQENNPEVKTHGVIKDFYAVIDGQQRLTSLYIGLKGSYAYKTPYKRWRNDENSLPTRKLYINIKKPIEQEYDNQKKYDFRFLSERDLKRLGDKDKYYWFKVGDILEFEDMTDIYKFIVKEGLMDNEFATEVLNLMFQRFNKDPLINYYLETEQDPDKVLEIFIRTNSGGTPLSFSDLLMSIASANWKEIDARKEIEDTVEKVFNISGAGFRIDKDFVLKTCLVLFIENIKFELKNFGYENVKIFEDNWYSIKESIISTFELLYRLGFNNNTFRAKNAAIPIIYYVYHKGLSEDIIKANYNKDDLVKIKKWINLSFIKSIFAGQTDTILTRIRNVMRENMEEGFPLEEIAERFKNDPTKNYSLDDDFIDSILTSPYGSNDAYYLLTFLYPDLDYYNQDFHMDHIHPSSTFRDEELIGEIKDEKLREYMSNEIYWNSVLNLQLLNGDLNRSKKDLNLKDWAKENNITNRELFIDEEIGLEIDNFPDFIENRKKNLKTVIKEVLTI